MRLFPVAVSSEAMALSWANQEEAPQGATVVVDHEIRASGLHGRIWPIPPADRWAIIAYVRELERTRLASAPGAAPVLQ